MGVRLGPSGQGKYYTQVHGDTRYNRRAVRSQTRDLVQSALDELEEEYPLPPPRNPTKSSRLEIAS
jgi:hypothetical protein